MRKILLTALAVPLAGTAIFLAFNTDESGRNAAGTSQEAATRSVSPSEPVPPAASVPGREGPSATALGSSSALVSRATPSLDDIPPCALREELAALPPGVRSFALERMGRLEIPAQDYNSLHVDGHGMLYYTCTGLGGKAGAETEFIAANAEAFEVAETQELQQVAAGATNGVPAYHSKAGSPNVLYLDFDGHTVTGTAWNTGEGSRAAYYCTPYDWDDLPLSFSDYEREIIHEIWMQVADDYAPFDIDVTTEEPSAAAFATNRVARALITSRVDSTGHYNPSGANSGGVAYVDVFGFSMGSYGYHNYYSPAFVYYDGLAGLSLYIAYSVSHEVGHNMGLSHDGTTDGDEYYHGHVCALYSETAQELQTWFPIMGSGYGISQWSNGTYYHANNQQDDLSILGLKLGYRADEQGVSISSAVPLTQSGTSWTGTGYIGVGGDSDILSFTSTLPELHISVVPSMTRFTTNYSTTLDVKVELLNSSGVLTATYDPKGAISVAIEGLRSPATHYLRVSGGATGNPSAFNPTGYTSYGSLGAYDIFVSAGAHVAWAGTESTLPTYSGSNWFTSPWYGSFYAEPDYDGWIYHTKHGWQYVYGVSSPESGVYIYDCAMQTYWYIDVDAYPCVYIYGDGAWYYYRRGSVPSRLFYDYQNGTDIGEAAL